MHAFIHIFFILYIQFIEFIFSSDPEAEMITSLGVKRFSLLAHRTNTLIKSSPKYIFADGDIFYLYSYHNSIVRKAIWQLKYRNSMNIATFLAKVLYFEYKTLFFQFYLHSQKQQVLLIPLPVSQKRKKERGYNHIERLAKNLSNFFPKHIVLLDIHSLQKIRDTERQALIKNIEKRKTNIKNCFMISPGTKQCIKNKYVIVIDDVATTGSTLQEAAACLRGSGAKCVICLVIAH